VFFDGLRLNQPILDFAVNSATAFAHYFETTMKAIWNNTVIAESPETVLVEGNHYFPEASLKREFVTFSNHKSVCGWKGNASYYSLLVNGELNPDAVWYYADPKPEAEMVRGHVGFWKGVKVGE
jgi:uncharacterized protein (DUF427 family)